MLPKGGLGPQSKSHRFNLKKMSQFLLTFAQDLMLINLNIQNTLKVCQTLTENVKNCLLT